MLDIQKKTSNLFYAILALPATAMGFVWAGGLIVVSSVDKNIEFIISGVSLVISSLLSMNVKEKEA